MSKYKGTLYRSRIDLSTWSIIALTAVVSLSPLVFDDDGRLPLVVCGLMLAFVVIVMLSVYYRIDGNNLVVYQMFMAKAYPIDKISEIKPSHTWISAPATSLTHRIGIKFSDRSVLKSTMPLVISPVRQAEFVHQLKTINPNIQTDIK